MDLSTLKPAEGSVTNNKRLGRGQGSGKGATSGRGHKGHTSRSGSGLKRTFEGGQMPIVRRVPKFGFTNINRVAYKAVNLVTLQDLAEQEHLTAITPEILAIHGFARKKDLIKILGKGTLSKALEVKAHAFSKSAQQAIEAAKGTAIKL